MNNSHAKQLFSRKKDQLKVPTLKNSNVPKKKSSFVNQIFQFLPQRWEISSFPKLGQQIKLI